MDLCRQFLGRLCAIQNDYTNANFKMYLYNEDDFMEIINELSFAECTIAVSSITADILDYIEDGREVEDEIICPWCRISNYACESCSYGNRYGICNEPGSKWYKYMENSKIPMFSDSEVQDKIIEMIQNYNIAGCITLEPINK